MHNANGFTDPDGRFHPATHMAFDRPATPLPTRIDTAADLTRWRDEHAAAGREVEALVRRRAPMLASATVEQIQAHDAETATARVRVERAASVIAAAEARFAELAERVRAAQPERRAKHEAAIAARDEAERIVREVYGPAAAMIAQALTKVGELQAVVDAAGEPPESCDRVPGCDAFRHPAGTLYHEALRDAVVLPPVVHGEPRFWPSSR